MYSFRTKKKSCLVSTNWIRAFFILFSILSLVLVHTSNAQQVRYASNFEIQGNTITVVEPSPGAPSESYEIAKNPSRIICTSTTHLHFLELLGVEDKLVGFPGTNYIYSPQIRKRVQEGDISEIGPGGKLNVEKALALNPDLIIAFDAGKESSTLNLLRKAGIEIMLNGDYMEGSALGRAEWILFFGKIFGLEEKADSIFRTIETNYNNLKSIAQNVEDRPTIMTGNMYGDTWFLPGGQNWFSTFFQQAGGIYLWEDNNKSGWIELSFESVLAKAREADLWIGTAGFSSRNMMLSADERYQNFSPFQEEKVFNYDRRLIEKGGNDFFESAYARPDLVLADLISVIQPDLLPHHVPTYIRKLK